MLDLRLPIGLMFSLVGAMMLVYGLYTGWSDPELYNRSLGININAWWGGVLVVFGAAMLFMGLRAGSNDKK